MSTSNNDGVKNCKLRKGDIVRHPDYGIGVVVATWAWYLIKGHIDVNFSEDQGTGTITEYKKIKLVKKRENVKTWWDYIY